MLPVLENTLTVDVGASKRLSKDNMDSSVAEPFGEILSAEAAKPPQSIDAVSPDVESTPFSDLEPASLQAELSIESTGLNVKPAPIEPVPIETTRTSMAIEGLSLNTAAGAERGQVGGDGNILRTSGKNLPVLPPGAVLPGENKEDSVLVDDPVTALGIYPASVPPPPTGVLAKVNYFFNLNDQGGADSIPSQGKASVAASQDASLVPGFTTKTVVRSDGLNLQGTPSESLPAITEKLSMDNSHLRLDSDPSALKQSAITPTQALIGSGTLPFGALEGSPGLKMSGPQVLSTPLGGPQWNSDLAGRVTVMVNNGTSEASLQLTPPELGRLEIKIVTEGDQAKINFVVHSADAKDAIELAMPRLRDMLGQVGLQLAQGEVADQSQSHRGERNTSNSLSEHSPASSEEGLDEPVTAFAAREVTGLVDYYV